MRFDPSQQTIVDDDGNEPTLLAVVQLAARILDRDGIRPLMGETFNQTEYEAIQNAAGY